ncbi:MAG: polysaccharide biosynthesis C-terminal domain-containing protein [Pseudomonadota bacterium]
MGLLSLSGGPDGAYLEISMDGPSTEKLGSSDSQELARGALINVVGILARFTRGAYIVLFPRLFGADVFGRCLLLFAVNEVLGRVTGAGFEWGVLRSVSRLTAQGREGEIRPFVMGALRRVLVLSLGLSALFAAVSSWLAVSVFRKPELAGPLALSCVTLPVLNAEMVLLFAIRGMRKMQYEVYVKSMAEPLLTLVTGLLAFLLMRNIYGVTLSYVATISGGLVLSWFYFRSMFPKSKARQVASEDWSAVATYSLPMSGMDLLNTLKSRLELIVVGPFLPLPSVAVFGAALELGNLIRKVRQAFEPIFMPLTAHVHELNDRGRLQRHYALGVRWTLLAALFVYGPMVVAPDLLLSAFGPGFSTGGPVLILVGAGMVFYVTIGLADAVLSMTGHAWANVANSLVLVALNLILAVALVPRFGILGAAWATAISVALVSVLRAYQAFRYEKVHPFHASQLKPLAAAALAGGGAAMVRWWIGGHSLSGAVLSLAVFFSLDLLLLAVVFKPEPEGREILREIWARIRHKTFKD